MTSKTHPGYESLIRKHRLYTEKESRRLAELDVVAQILHERAMVAEGILDAFDSKVTLGTCGYCGAARGELVTIAYRERQEAHAAQEDLHAYARDISSLRADRAEGLHIAYKRQWESQCAKVHPTLRPSAFCADDDDDGDELDDDQADVKLAGG